MNTSPCPPKQCPPFAKLGGSAWLEEASTLIADAGGDILPPGRALYRVAPNHTRSRSSARQSLTLKAERILSWCDGVREHLTRRPASVNSAPPDFSGFTFPPRGKLEDTWCYTGRDPEFEVILNSGPLQRNVTLGPLHSAADITHLPGNGIPDLVLNVSDFVGPHRLLTGARGFMYFDPNLEGLRGIVDSRALVVPCNDPVLDASACFQNHAVRLFVEAESARGKYECLGNYYLLWTPQKLDGSAWKSVDEATKTAIFNRYIDTLLTPPEDPIPGRLYTPKRLHQLLDRGGIFPLVILRPANTPELTISAGADIMDISPDASFMDPSSTLDTRSYLDMDDSVMHDFEISIGSAQISHATGTDAQDALYTSLAAYRFPSLRRAGVTAHYPSLSGFRFPPLRIPTAAPLALTDGDLDMLRARDAAEVRAMHHVMAALPDVRWRDGAAFWKAAEVVSALCVAMHEGGDKWEHVLEGVGYRVVGWFQDAGIGFGPGPGVGRIGE